MIKIMRQTSFSKRKVRYEEIHAIQQEDFDVMVRAAAIRDGYRILDCGCGYGAVTRELLQATDEKRESHKWHNVIDLIDECQEQLVQAKIELRDWLDNSNVTLNFLHKTFPLDFSCADRYDVAFVKMVLHEMPINATSESNNNHVTQQQFMEGLWRCLKPGGVLVLWDLSLTPTTRDFFSSIIRKKDLIAGFTTLVQNRNFLSNQAITSLFAKSGLVVVRQIKSVDYKFSSKKRLYPELNGNMHALEEWNAHIRTEARKLSKEVLYDELAYEDSGDDITFTVKVGIFQANKPCDLQFILDPFGSEDAGAKLVEEPTQSYLTVTKQSLVEGQLLHRLAPNSGLMRASILTRQITGHKELCREGLDFLYNYTDKSKQLKQAEGYLAYLTGLYCSLKDNSRMPNLRSMSEAVSNVFQRCSSAGWLIVSLKDSNTLQVEIGSYNSISGQALVKIPSRIDEFFMNLMSFLDTQKDRFDFETVLHSLPLVRITMKENKGAKTGNDFDTAAEILRESYFTLWIETVGSIRDKDMAMRVVLPSPHLITLLSFPIVFANLYGYLKFSGTPHCYYFLPPSVRMNDVRLDDGVFVLSSFAQLSNECFEVMLKYVAGFWSGIGNLDSLRYGKQIEEHEQQLKKKLAIQGFTHQVGHILGEKSGHPLIAFAKALRKAGSNEERQRLLQVDLDFRSAQIEYACILPEVFADTLQDGEEDLTNLKGEDVKSIVQYVWDQLIIPCARIGKENENYGIYLKTPKLIWKNEFKILSKVPDNELIRALLFEAFWNACRHGDYKKDEKSTEAEIHLNLFPIAGAVIVQIANMVADNKSPSDNDMLHMRAFVNILRSWKPKSASEMFDIDFRVDGGYWTTALQFPVIE
jgi:SAM-dependent methyltransferase